MLERVVLGSPGSFLGRSLIRNLKTIVRQSSNSNVKHIKSLTHTERKHFLDSFDRVFCDCDGVIWHAMHDAIPGSSEAIDYLRRCGKQVTFVTNNTIFSPSDLLQRFRRCNIPVEMDNVVHPAQTICDHLREIRFDGLIYCIASTPFKNQLRESGFQIVEERNRVITESLHDMWSAIFSEAPVKAVIIDADFNLTGAKLMRAHTHLKDPECLLIGGAADSLISFGGLEVMGPGPFLNMVEKSTGREATILGKPGLHLCERLRSKVALGDHGRVLFVGDSLNSDIRFGKMCGFQTLLVLSGGTKPQDLNGDLPEQETPDYVADDLGDFVGFLEGK